MSLQPVDYDAHQHRVYANARAISAEMLACWMAAFAAHAPDRRPLDVLDLGSGTGRFTPALAGTFGGRTCGVEPSQGMRAVAEAQAAHPRVAYPAGEAGAIPLPDASVDLVLMFLSYHHFPDKPAAARGIARVLRPGGRVLLRGAFSDRRPPTWWNPYFPRLTEIEQALFPTLPDTLRLFEAVGLARLALEEIEEEYSKTEEEQLERLRLKGVSTFDLLSQDEIRQGFERLEADWAAGRLKIPLTAPSDLLVLG